MRVLAVTLALLGLFLGSAQADNLGDCTHWDTGLVYENPGQYPAMCDPLDVPGYEGICDTLIADPRVNIVDEADYADSVMAWHALIGPYVLCRWENYWHWIEVVISEMPMPGR